MGDYSTLNWNVKVNIPSPSSPLIKCKVIFLEKIKNCSEFKAQIQ